MSKIAVLGSSVDNFLKSHYDIFMVEKIVFAGLSRLMIEDDILFSTGEHGAPNMALNYPKCKKQIYLPIEPGLFCKNWTKEEQIQFGYQLDSAEVITITNTAVNGMGHVRKMFSEADHIISFWVGERIGSTFEQMLLALSLNKTIYHGLDDNELTYDILMGGWGPK